MLLLRSPYRSKTTTGHFRVHPSLVTHMPGGNFYSAVLNNARYRCAASIFYIRGCPCNCARGRNSSEDGGKNIGRTLIDQFQIGFMISANHSVCYCSVLKCQIFLA
jgi:hypothetical protein